METGKSNKLTQALEHLQSCVHTSASFNTPINRNSRKAEMHQVLQDHLSSSSSVC